MKIQDFALEVYFDRYEFTAPYLLAQSDCEAMQVGELLEMDPDGERLLRETWLGYTEVAGVPALREAVAALYEHLEADEILMHTGAQEAIFAYMNVLLQKGDHMVCMFPTYQSLYEVANAEGVAVSRWELRQGGDRWELDFDELERLIRPNTRLLVVNTPNNPTGYTFTQEQVARVCAIAERHGLYIFADEVYKGLDLDGAAKPWFADCYSRAVSLGVISKSYGLAGLRIGWLAGRDKALLDKVKRFKHYLSICNSSASETLALIALRNGEHLLRRNLSIIRENIAAADTFFARHPATFHNLPPRCGPIAFHRLAAPVPIDDFCAGLVQNAGVLLLPSSVYGVEGSYFRMGYGRRSFRQNLAVLDEYLRTTGL